MKIQMQNIQNTAQNMHYVDSFSLQQNILTKIVTETKQLKRRQLGRVLVLHAIIRRVTTVRN